jgi:hypothetical protein
MLLGAASAAAACQPTLITGAERRALRALKVESAEADARKAIAAGDWMLLGVGGYATSYPGTPLFEGMVDTHRGTQFLRGTSDFLQDDDHEQLQRHATAYAERYNAEVIRLGGYRPVERGHIQRMEAREEANQP